jgi:uncharacterized protein (DUF433 family)
MAEALTVNEAAALSGLDAGRVRKDAELGVVPAGSPPRFELDAVAYFSAVVVLGFELGVEDRKKLFRVIRKVVHTAERPDVIEWSPIIQLRIGKVVGGASERMRRFLTWKAKLGSNPQILGGEVVFPRTRLAVRQIGGMLLRGASPEELRADHPWLTDQDLEFAKLYTTAHPRVGRPRERQAPRR